MGMHFGTCEPTWHHLESFLSILGPLGSIWAAFLSILGQLVTFWEHFGDHFGSIFKHLGGILTAFKCVSFYVLNFGLILGHLGLILGSSWGHFGFILGTCWHKLELFGI